MSGKNFDIFISYRRSDGDAIARILNAEFALRNFRCFLDFDNLKGGKFDERIEAAIIDAPVFVMVLTPGYFSRCNEKADWVRREIELALAKEKVIVPINYDKNLNGIPDYLEKDFKERIDCHQFATVHKDDTFKSSFNQMVEERILSTIGDIIKPENKAKVSVLSDIDCDLIEDNEVIATLQKDETNFILLERGEHAITARSNEHPQIKKVIEKTINDISFKYLLKIELANQVQGCKNAIAQEEKSEKDEIKRRQEEKEKRKQKRKEWWGRNKRKLLITLAVIFGLAIIIGLNNSSIGETETPTETATETITKTQTIIPVVENVTSISNNEDSIRKAEEQKKEEERKLKEEQKKKKRDEEKFKEYKKKGDDYYLLLVGNPDNKDYKDQAKYYYGLALQYKEDITIRNRFEKLKR